MLPTPRSRLSHRLLGLVALGLGATLMAACGSTLDPDEVGSNRARGPVATNAAGQAIDPDTGDVLPDSGSGSGTGSGSDPSAPLTDAAGDPLPVTGSDPGSDPGVDPGADPGVDPTADPGADPTADPGADPSDGPGPPKTNDDVCQGFKNGPGITDDKIIVGNASDISGPQPGLFQPAQDAAKAYVDYFNATSDICGRKLELKTYDSKTDAGADQQAYTAGCSEVFAMVGSTSAFDSGGAATAQSCGLPDLRTAALTLERAKCSTCYGSQSTNARQFENAVADYVKKYYPEAASKAAFLYLNAGASSENAKVQQAAETARGMKFVYSAGIDVTEFNYGSYAQGVKDAGAQYVQFIGSYQASVKLAQALDSVGYKPQVYMQDPTAYDNGFVEGGQDAVEGTTVFTNFLPFAEAGSNQEMATYLGYLRQSNPSAQPTFFGTFSWSAFVLFTETAAKLGGKLSRDTLLAELGKVKNWTAHGLTQPQNVGSKQTAECWRFLQLSNGRWVNGKSGSKPICSGTTSV